jgi:ATP-dependent Clp protease ATP-binding subunit ClpB
VLDDGRLTDGQGRTVDFKNTIVIMTSNIGSQNIQEYFGRSRREEAPTSNPKSSKSRDLDSYKELEKEIMAELKRHFRPEFLNRVDDVIIFQSLDEEDLSRIVDIQLEKLKKRLAQQQLTLDVDAAAKKLLAKEGYDPQFGARPLKRAVQERILNPLSIRLLEGEFKPGDKIKVAADGDRLVFKAK